MIQAESRSLIARVSARIAACLSPPGSGSGGSTTMRKRQGPRRSIRPGITGQPKRSASCAGAGAVMAGSPSSGTAMPSFSFWSASMPSTPPWARKRSAARAPAEPLGNSGSGSPAMAAARQPFTSASTARLSAAR